MRYGAAFVVVVACVAGCIDDNALLGGPGAPDLAPAFQLKRPVDLALTFDPLDSSMDDAEPAQDLEPSPDLATPPDLARPCAGWRGGPTAACWYMGSLGEDCLTVCANHGGFDVKGATHKGGAVVGHFFPDAILLGSPDGNRPVESHIPANQAGDNTEHGTNSDGNVPLGSETTGNTQTACACTH